MTRPAANNPSNQPTLESLMTGFLASRSDAMTAVESGATEVEPHEVAAGFRVDPRAAWLDATAPFGANSAQLPPEWAALVAQPSPAFALPMAAGHFPQRVKDLQPLLRKFDPAELRPSGAQPALPAFAGLRGWVKASGAAHPLVAAGISRTLGDFDAAAALLANAADGNENAALLWQRGACAEALSAWDALPDTPAVLFNRGMARLFLGRTADARDPLQKAVEAIPEASGWHALARLYLAVAAIHG